jgi:hypothetical protein
MSDLVDAVRKEQQQGDNATLQSNNSDATSRANTEEAGVASNRRDATSPVILSDPLWNVSSVAPCKKPEVSAQQATPIKHAVDRVNPTNNVPTFTTQENDTTEQEVTKESQELNAPSSEPQLASVVSIPSSTNTAVPDTACMFTTPARQVAPPAGQSTASMSLLRTESQSGKRKLLSLQSSGSRNSHVGSPAPIGM